MASNFDCNLDDYRSAERDHPLIYSCRVPGFAEAIGLKPESADDELVIDTFLTSLAWSGDAEKALSYSRHRGHYKRSRYRRPAFTYKTAMRIVEQIRRAGLALEDRTLPGHRGRQSTLTATPEVMTAWRRMGLDPIHDSNAETIILKSRDEERRYLEYIDSSEIRAMRDSLRPIKEMLNSIQTEVPAGIKIGKDLLMFETLDFDDYDRPFVKRHHVRMHKGVRRIFTGNFRQHGRLYCAHQNIPSEARQAMSINGERVIELDFSALHPTLLHNIAGVLMDGDPYDIGGGFKRVPDGERPPARPIRQLRSRCRWGWHGGRPPASHRASPSGTIQLQVFDWHNHVISVLRPEAKLFGLRCLTIIGTEGGVIPCGCPFPRFHPLFTGFR
jgi:hypothetical protein